MRISRRTGVPDGAGKAWALAGGGDKRQGRTARNGAGVRVAASSPAPGRDAGETDALDAEAAAQSALVALVRALAREAARADHADGRRTHGPGASPRGITSGGEGDG